MHTFHLGVAQDLLGSTIKLMVKTKALYPGPTISKRLRHLFLEAKQWAKTNGKQLALKRLRKETLRWSQGCPVLKTKAADSSVFLPFLCEKLEQVAHWWQSPYRGLLAAVWSANQLATCLMGAGVFLTPEEKQNVDVIGSLFLKTYARLAREARDKGEFHFRMRPKFHHLQHMLEDTRPSCRNPGWDNTFMDEDHVRYCVRMLRKVSHVTAEKHLLQRNAIQVKQYLLRACEKYSHAWTASGLGVCFSFGVYDWLLRVRFQVQGLGFRV